MCGTDTELVLAEVEAVELKLCANCIKFGKVKSRSGNNYYPQRHSTKIAKPSMEFRIVSDYFSIIKSAREKRNLNQEDFSKLIQEKESILQKWESGALKPSIESAKRLERILNIILIQKEEDDTETEKQPNKRNSDIFTLGDFIKIKKRN